MRRLLPVIFFLITVNAFAQTKQLVDSLEKRYQQAGSDTAKFNALVEVISAYRMGNTRKAGEKCNELLKLAEKINDPLFTARAINHLGTQKRKEGNYDTAATLYLQALPVFERYHDDYNISVVCNSLGIMYWQQQELDLALRYMRRSMTINEKMNKVPRLIANLINIGGVFKDKNQKDSAIVYLKRAVTFSEESKDTASLADACGNLGAIYLEKGDTVKSLPYCMLGLKFSEQSGNNYQLMTSVSNIGEIYLLEKKYTEAESYFLRAQKISEELQSPESRASNYKSLATLYDSIGDMRKSLDYLWRYTSLHDSTLNVSRMKQITDLEAKYQSTKSAKDLLAAKADSEKKTILVYSLSIGLLLVIALAFFTYRGYVNKRNLSIEIQRQKEIIEIKNHEILDSIHYAERIQQALLPSQTFMKEQLPDSFVLLLPKDIVAGDFFWMEKRGDILLFAAADCTGHGVPGAMVSMLGTAFLNEIVNVENQLQPAEILNRLRDKIIQAMKQSADAQNRDGMDIALCAYNTSTRELQFAGAQNPLWIIRNNTFEEVKADKQPVGINAGEQKPFTAHTLTLQAGDCLYLFSDGYADQFGGEKKKKFMSKQFREYLHRIHALPMKEQETALLRHHREWKGDLEQVDDILVIGVRV